MKKFVSIVRVTGTLWMSLLVLITICQSFSWAAGYSVTPNHVIVTAGGSGTTLTLHGTGLDQITACVVVRDGHLVAGITSSIGQLEQATSSRKITLKASTVTMAGDAQLRLMFGTKFFDIPLNMALISIASSGTTLKSSSATAEKWMLSSHPVIGPMLTAVIKPAKQKNFTHPPKSFKQFTLAEFNTMVSKKTGKPSSLTLDDKITLPNVRNLDPNLGPVDSYNMRKDPTNAFNSKDLLTKRGQNYISTRKTLPRTMRVGDIIHELNTYEQNFCAQGYSLRDQKIGKNVIGKLDLNKESLEAQQKNINTPSAHIIKTKIQAPMGGIGKLANPAKQMSKTAAGRIASYDPDKSTGNAPQYVPLHRAFHPTYSGGDPDILEGSLYNDFILDADNSSIKLQASENVEVSLFGQNVKFFSIDSTMTVPSKAKTDNSKINTRMTMPSKAKTDNSKINTSVIILGNQVSVPAQFNQTSTYITVSEVFGESVSQSVETQFQVGPVPVVVRVGFVGEVGFRPTITLDSNNSKMSATVNPYLDTKVFAEAGVGVSGIADAGVGGNLTLINDDIKIEATVEAKDDYFATTLSGTNTLDMLNGNLYVYINVDCYLYSGEYEYDIFDWSGFNAPYKLFDPINEKYYPNKDKILTVEVNSITRANEETANACPLIFSSLSQRQSESVLVEVWENAQVPDDFYSKYKVLEDWRAHNENGHGEIYVVGCPFQPSVTSLANLDIPVSSKGSPYVVRIALIEFDKCTHLDDPLYYLVEVASGGNKVFMIQYDVLNHQFQGWPTTNPPYLTQKVPRGTEVNVKTDIPKMSFTLKDRAI